MTAILPGQLTFYQQARRVYCKKCTRPLMPQDFLPGNTFYAILGSNNRMLGFSGDQALEAITSKDVYWGPKKELVKVQVELNIDLTAENVKPYLHFSGAVNGRPFHYDSQNWSVGVQAYRIFGSQSSGYQWIAVYLLPPNDMDEKPKSFDSKRKREARTKQTARTAANRGCVDRGELLQGEPREAGFEAAEVRSASADPTVSPGPSISQVDEKEQPLGLTNNLTNARKRKPRTRLTARMSTGGKKPRQVLLRDPNAVFVVSDSESETISKAQPEAQMKRYLNQFAI